jgi:hypothetical protein
VDVLVTFPDDMTRVSLDGAVVELAGADDDPRLHFTAEVRIPAPTDQP